MRVATSANAFSCLDVKRPDFNAISTLPVYAVGERTAQMARSRGFGVIAAVEADAHSLEPHLRALRGRDVLYLAGRDRKPVIEEALQQAAASCHLVEIYRAVAAKSLTAEFADALRARRVEAVVHFSRRSASVFARLACEAHLEKEAAALLHFCLSADVAQGLSSLMPQLTLIAETPDADAMLRLITSKAG